MDPPLNLFTIDVEAGIRKLATQRYTTAWEPFVELIRLAASFDPQKIEVAVSRGRFAIRAPGATPNEALFIAALTVFDERLSHEKRHEAISEIEREFGLGILSAFAGRPSRVRVTWTKGDKVRGIRFALGRHPKRFTPKVREDFGLEIIGSGLNRAEQRMVEERCRHAELPIIINHRRVSRNKSVDNCLLWTTVRGEALSGVAGIPDSGDLTQITRLKQGIVDDEIFFPAVRGLITSAVVEDNLEDIQEVGATVRKVGRKLYQKLAAHYGELSAEGRKRAETLLFDRFDHTRDFDLFKGVKAFMVHGEGCIDFIELKIRMQRSDLFAIDAESPTFLYELDNRLVVVLDKPQRRFLESALDMTLKEPPRRAYFTSLRERLIALATRSRRALARAFRPQGAVVSAESLTPAESRFVAALETALGSNERAPTVRMTSGGTLPWRAVADGRGRVEYRFPRRHKLVKRMVEAYAENPAYLQPALVLLTEGEEA